MPEDIVYKPTTPPQDVEVPRYFEDTQQFLNKKYVSKTASATPTANNFYTVPVNTLFVLLSATYSATGNNGTGLGDGEVKTSNADFPLVLFTAGISVPVGTILSVNHSVNFGKGIAFFPGTSFSLDNGSSPHNVCVLHGYEMPLTFK